MEGIEQWSCRTGRSFIRGEKEVVEERGGGRMRRKSYTF